MRFLKNKIQLARIARELTLKKEQHAKEQLQSVSSPSTQASLLSPQSEQSISVQSPKQKISRKRCPKDSPDAKVPNPTKNIILNFSKAIGSFAISTLALPYLRPYIVNGQLNHQEFIDFVTIGKANIGGIKSFKTLLIATETDSAQVKLYKELFKMLSIIFVRDFSTNWIACGRVTNKDVYLKYRAQLLQKLQNPEDFIYFIRKQVRK